MATAAHRFPFTVCATPAAAVAWLRARLGWTVDASFSPVAGPQLRTDSRQVLAGDVFIAWPGFVQDGRAHVASALRAGAAACLVEADGLAEFLAAHAEVDWDVARVVAVSGLKAATGPIADLCFAQPSQVVRVVGTTGTNGKTSTAWWMAQGLTLAGQACGVIGTLGVGTVPTRLSPAGHIVPTGFTTPDPVTLQAGLRRFADEGVKACALEATSIGLAEHRLDAVHIDTLLYTNFTPDHLDYHVTMAAYWDAKRAAFNWPGLRATVLNLDDAQGAALAAELQAQGRLQVWTYAHCAPAAPHAARHLQALNVRYEAGGLSFDVQEGAEQALVRSGLVGDYNVANLLAVLGGLRSQGVTLAQAAALAAEFTSVPGRMQRINDGREAPLVVVDYAHTPDALDKAVQAVRPLAAARGGKLICVFGCGGDRDNSKRPVMGRIAAEGADRVIVTSDNPRTEAPESIVDMILAGITRQDHVRRLTDRREAIRAALQDARAPDVVLIAGKGHEDYQDIGGRKLPFSDIEEAQRWLPGAPVPVTAAVKGLHS